MVDRDSGLGESEEAAAAGVLVMNLKLCCSLCRSSQIPVSWRTCLSAGGDAQASEALARHREPDVQDEVDVDMAAVASASRGLSPWFCAVAQPRPAC
jgi:hypothetical protein